jgi:hypothetical protein
MQKKVVIPAIIVAILLICAVFYFTPKTFGKNVDPAEVASITVFDGNTGQGFTIDDPEEISYIVENIQQFSMPKTGISLGRTGYGFRLNYLDENGKNVVPQFCLSSDQNIRKDPFFYGCGGGLCFDYLKELEAKYAG